MRLEVVRSLRSFFRALTVGQCLELGSEEGNARPATGSSLKLSWFENTEQYDELRGRGIFAIMALAALRAFDLLPCRRQVDVGSLNQSPPILLPASSSFIATFTLAVWNDLPLPSKRKPGTLRASFSDWLVQMGTLAAISPRV